MQNEIRKTEQVLPIMIGRADNKEPQPFDPENTRLKVAKPLFELLQTIAQRNEAVFTKKDKNIIACCVPMASRDFYFEADDTPERVCLKDGWVYLTIYEKLDVNSYNENGGLRCN